jgi:hypothetical protein
MNTVTAIKDIQDPHISPYRSLEVNHPGKDGLFIVENRPAVMSLLESNTNIADLTVRVRHLFNEVVSLKR